MESKDKRLEYGRHYDKANTVGFYMKLNKMWDADVIEWLRRQPNKQGYLKALIRADMIKHAKGE